MTLTVDINDYPYPKSFPGGYYDSLLKPGMSLEKVHSIIKGYHSVYHCGGGNNSEIYYFFGDKETNAIVWLVQYDDNKLYEDRSEGYPGDQTVGGYGCLPGLLD